MTDVSELVGRCRAGHDDGVTELLLREAADALEAQEQILERCHEEKDRLRGQLHCAEADLADALAQLAKLAPVVEAAREWAQSMKALGNGLSIERMERADDKLLDAIATLESTHD